MILRRLFLAMTLFIASVSVFADKTVIVDLSAQYGTETNVELSTVDFNDVTLTFRSNDGTSPIYNYNHFRLNKGNSLSIKAKNGKKIVMVKFGVAARNYLTLAHVTPETYNYTYDAEKHTQIITGENSDSICIFNDGTKQARINTITITLNDGGKAAAAPEELKLESGDCGMINDTTKLTWNLQNSTIVILNPDSATVSLNNPTFNVNHVRFKAGNKFIVTGKQNISKVVLKYVLRRDPVTTKATYTVDPDSYKWNEKMDTLSGEGAKEVSFTTTKQVRINYIGIIYEGGNDENPIDVHDNYVMMPTVVVTSEDQLPASENPNTIYYVNEKSTVAENTDKNIVLVGTNSTVSYNQILHDGYPYENVMSYHQGHFEFKKKMTEKISTLVLPFSTSVPSDVKAYTFAGVEGDGFNFTQVDTLNAYEPYLLECSAEGDTLTDFSSEWQIFNAVVTPQFAKSVTVGDYTFTGTTLQHNTADAIKGTNVVYRNDVEPIADPSTAEAKRIGTAGVDCTTWTKSDKALKVLGAFITGPDNGDKTTLLNGVATGIKNIRLKQNDGQTRIYTIDGRYVGTQDVNSLSSGLYIINDKKVVIK